jgi:hypothetical protein
MAFEFIDRNVAKEFEDSQEQYKEIPMEWNFDIDNKDFVINEKGHVDVVYGQDAIKIWVYKCLMTARGKYMAYDFSFGNDVEYLLEENIDKDLLKAEAKRLVVEALMTNKFINSVTNVNVEIEDKTLKIELTVNTDYGDIDIKY